ncbi:chemotaxis protein CheW, partial [Thalassolituus sp.]|uniref:chemotaxis protein CheW n=1 Tax=Thalassolituus sp. TaxID=2030822 RepID=UPI0027D49CA8
MSAAEEINELDELDNDERQQYVTFRVGDELFAVEMNPVQEIIRVPDVVRVPLAPPSLCGLANLRGKVLPILSLRYLFGIPDAETDEATRAVVIDVGQPLGFVVDRVASVIDCDPAQLEDASKIKSSVDTTLLKGVIKNSAASSMVMVVDFKQLIEHEFAHLEQLTNENSMLSDGLVDDSMNQEEVEEESDEIQLVSFNVDRQEYAIHIDDVKEIVQMPESITSVPRSPYHILGLMNLRDQLLPLVDLRTMFALMDKDPDEKSRVIVVTSGGYFLGIVVDSVSEVLRINKDTVEALIPALAKETELSDITDICRLNDGERLVSILSIERFFDSGNLQETISELAEDNML